MRYAILGDIHGNWEALTAVLDDARQRGVDQHLSVGDLVGYNPDPIRCIDHVRDIGCIVVQGNHDFFSVRMPSTRDMSAVAAAAIEWTRAHLHDDHRLYLGKLPRTRMFDNISIAHNTLEEPRVWQYMLEVDDASRSFAFQRTPLCFIGHTHVPVLFHKKDRIVTVTKLETFKLEPESQYVVNVGSVGQPRDRDPRASYVIYDSETGEITLKRIAYEVGRTQEKIRKSGLPLWLALRLSFGI